MYISRIQMQFCFPIFLLPFNSCLCLASLLLSSVWCLKAPSCSCDALMAARWPTIRALVVCVSSCSFLFPDPLRLPVSIFYIFSGWGLLWDTHCRNHLICRVYRALGKDLNALGTRQRALPSVMCLSSVLVAALGLPSVRYNALDKAQSTLQTGGFR